MKLPQWFLFGFFTICLSGTFVFTQTVSKEFNTDKITLKELAGLIAKRADYMKQVAMTKYADKQIKAVIYDWEQENKVLEKTIESAENFDLPKATTLCFEQIQMDIAKQIQSYWINIWSQQITGPIEQVVVSLPILREKIKKINQTLLLLISKSRHVLSRCPQKKIAAILKEFFERAEIKPSALMFVYLDMMAFCLKSMQN